jgi:hypothetical protein
VWWTPLLLACSDEKRPEVAAVQMQIERTADSIVRLSHAPNTVATSSSATALVEQRLRYLDRDSIQHISDVTDWFDGRIAVLDRLQKQILLLDAEGRITQRVGREGMGPGEFTDPVALTRAGNRVVVLDVGSVSHFSVFDATGQPVATATHTQPGDWVGNSWREPHQGMEKPFQAGPEDWSRRLTGVNDSTFVYRIQDDERRYLMGVTDTAPRAHLLRYSIPSFVTDTLWKGTPPGLSESRAPVTDREGRPMQVAQPSVVEKLLVARPVFATGEGWHALHLPGSTAFEIVYSSGESMQMEWPSGTRAITESDRLEIARHRYLQTINRSDRAARRWKLSTEDGKNAILRTTATLLTFADSIPEVMAAYGSGDCLWIAGTNPLHHIDGTATTLVGVDVRRWTTPVAVTIPKVGRRIRHINAQFLFATYKDEDDVMRLEAYALPSSGCTSPN